MFKEHHKLLKSRRMLRIYGGARGGVIKPINFKVFDKLAPEPRKQWLEGSWDIETPQL